MSKVFPATIPTALGNVILAKNKDQSVELDGKNLKIWVVSPMLMAPGVAGAISIMPASK